LQGKNEEHVKPLPKEVRLLIEQVQQNCQRDDYNLLINPSLHLVTPPDVDENPEYWCCSNHQQDCLVKRSQHFEMRKFMLSAMIQSECDRLEEYQTAIGYVSRYQLEFILQHLFMKCQLSSLKENNELVARQLIDQCVMSPEEQQRHQIYSSQIARENPCCDIPLRAYSIKTFVRIVTNFILSCEMNILLNTEPSS
jgi:hypothetical protein